MPNHTTVNNRLFNGLQALLAASHQLTQRQKKIRLHGKWDCSRGHIDLHIITCWNWLFRIQFSLTWITLQLLHSCRLWLSSRHRNPSFLKFQYFLLSKPLFLHIIIKNTKQIVFLKNSFSVDYEYFCDIMKLEDSGVDQLSWC